MMVWHLILMAFLYIFTGVLHFIFPKAYIKIIPPVLPYPKAINAITGFFELMLGVMLFFEPYRRLALIGLIILLILVFPANIYHHLKAKRKGVNEKATLIRLPIQLILIYWVWIYI